MATTHIPLSAMIEIKLSNIIKHMRVNTNVEFGTDVLQVSIKSEDVLNALELIAPELIAQVQNYTGNYQSKFGIQSYDAIEITFDEYTKRFDRKYSTVTNVVEDGWEQKGEE